MHGGLVKANIELYAGVDNVVELTFNDDMNAVKFDKGTFTAMFKRHIEDRTPVLVANMTAKEDTTVLILTAEQMKAIGRVPSYGMVLHYDIVQEVDGQIHGIAFGRAYVRGGHAMDRVTIRYNKPYKVVVNPQNDEVELIKEENGATGSQCSPTFEDRDLLALYILERGN